MNALPRRSALSLATAVLGLAAPAVAMAALAPEVADAELIRLCAEVGVHRDRFNREGTLDSDDCPIWAAYIEAADAISDAEPQTLAGMVAKARAAKAEATTMDGREEPAGTPAENWAWDLVNDLIRLGGEA